MHASAETIAREAQTPPAVIADLVLVHGWGSNRRTWAPLAGALAGQFRLHYLELPGHGENREPWPDTPRQLIDSWLETLPTKAIYLGWSLGGSLALLLAERYPERVQAVITLASNPCFVARPDWSTAMAGKDFEHFRQRLARNPAKLRRYFARLQTRGDKRAASVRQQLEAEARLGEATAAGLAAGLDTLAGLDLRSCVQQLAVPHLALFGQQDALVPCAVADSLPSCSSVWTLGDCGHAPHLSRPEAVAARVVDFALQRRPVTANPRKKSAVAAAFSRAEDYDRAALLQQEAGTALLKRLPDRKVDTLLDLGCGTGFFGQALKRHCHQLVGLDLAEGMLRRARANTGEVQWLCADAENLPLERDSIDQVYSSLAVQWCEDLPRLAREIARVLQPGGELALATLGPDTLWELRAAWRAVDAQVHVNRFATHEEMHNAFAAAGMELVGHDAERWLRRVAQVRQLARELRAIGAHNVNPGRQAGLTGKRRWQQLESAYRAIAGDAAGLPVTWALDFYRFRKPH